MKKPNNTTPKNSDDIFTVMTESDFCDVDNITSDIMDKIAGVLKHNESHFPNWDDDYNLYDCIRCDIHERILNHKLETTKA